MIRAHTPHTRKQAMLRAVAVRNYLRDQQRWQQQAFEQSWSIHALSRLIRATQQRIKAEAKLGRLA